MVEDITIFQNIEEIKRLQVILNNNGADLAVDGIIGEQTKTALNTYQETLKSMPLPPIPWWQSSSMKGSIVSIIGMIALFIPFLDTINTKELTDLIFNLAGNVNTLIQIIGSILTIFGVGKMAVGRVNAVAPIDTSKINPFIK